MRILHVGGYSAATQTLARYQRGLGHDVQVYGVNGEHALKLGFVAPIGPRPQIEDFIAAKFDIAHFHLTTEFPFLAEQHRNGHPLPPILRQLKDSGTKLVYYTYDCDLTNRAALEAQENSHCRNCALGGDEISLHPFCKGDPTREKRKAEIRDFFDHVFLGCPENFDVVSTLPRWSWLALPADTAEIPAPEPYEPEEGQIKILHVALRPAQMNTRRILMALESLKARGHKFHFKMIIPELLVDYGTLVEEIQDCDMLIEQTGRESFGALGLLAMTFGKTVVSSNSKKAKDRWEQLNFCPILDTNPTNIEQRLESILAQPKCLRDFGKRSRQYIDTYHNGETIAKLSIERYKQILK